MDPNFTWYVGMAVQAAKMSPCAKSQRGVVIWRGSDVVATGANHQPMPMVCDGSEACRVDCGKLCIHAERDALNIAGEQARGAELLHVKVADGKPVVSGSPSCWQCSRDILEAGIRTVWLLQADGLVAYAAIEFHEISLKHHGLPVITVKDGE